MLLYAITGKPISEFHAEQATKPNFKSVQVGLDWKRSELYDRINERVDQMIAGGLVDEVKGLRERGYDRHLNALNTVGYNEMFDYLDGLCSLETAVRLIKQNTRRYAKRQLTWFRADERIRWVPMSPAKSATDTADEIEKIFNRHRRGR